MSVRLGQAHSTKQDLKIQVGTVNVTALREMRG